MGQANAIATATETCFLSYSRADEDFALRLAKDLQALGVAMWIDRFDIRPSEHWDRAIERAIRGCRNVVAILSPRSIASENVADEISLAIDAGKPVISIMIEPCALPLRLTRRHLIDATAGYEAALKQCFAEIESGKSGPSLENAVAQVSRGIQDPEVLAAARRQLMTVMGPIAGILVEKAASRAASADGLYGLLALHIPDDTDRERFLASRAQPGALSIDAEPPAAGQAVAGGKSIRRRDLDRIAKTLTSFLGPIAPIVARNESRASGSIKDLLRRLAAKLRCERDRADFLRQAEAAADCGGQRAT
jgi:hypothetical protein